MLIGLNRFVRRLTRCRRGAAAVEFALVAPIFFTMLYGLFEAGRFYWYKNSLDYAVAEAARQAGIDAALTVNDLTTAVEANLQFNPQNVTVDVTDSTDAVTGLTFREITAAVPFSLYALDTHQYMDTQVTAKSKVLVLE